MLEEAPITIADRFRLDGRVALVTGASSGLGAHFAKTLASAGASVVLAARRFDKIAALAQSIQASGGTAHAVELDVTDLASVECAVAAAELALGPLQILINNAGVADPAGFLETSDAQWRHHLDVNLDGVMRVGRLVAKRMVANGQGGSIINTASIVGFMVARGISAYAVSKAGVVQLTKAMALELAPHKIRVNALAPGYVPTEINADFLASVAGKKMLSRFPMQRAGRLDELDGPLLLLASDAGSYMTGSIIVVDGGTLLSPG